jgi:hypothetical protein
LAHNEVTKEGIMDKAYDIDILNAKRQGIIKGIALAMVTLNQRCNTPTEVKTTMSALGVTLADLRKCGVDHTLIVELQKCLLS